MGTVPFNERVESYTVSLIQNDVVDYQQVVRLRLESGHQVFLAFPSVLPQPPVSFSAGNTTAFLRREEFDRIHQLLQTEAPLYFTALSLLGINAVNLSTDREPVGEGPADHDALVQLAAKLRSALETQGEPAGVGG
ncbi:MAG: hypothetical protein ACTHLJ_16540 [Angustibacter sp.]